MCISFSRHKISLIIPLLIIQAGFKGLLPGGAIYYSSCSDLKIQLLYGNLSSPFSFTPRDAESSVQIAFTNFMGGIKDVGYPDNGSVTGLEGNIDVDPLFNDADPR